MRRKGVSRILEAVFAAILIIEAAYISYFLMVPPNPTTPKQSEELSRLGYSLLAAISRNNGLDRLIFDSNWRVKESWENDFKITVTSLLPNNIIFNITVYNATLNSSTGFIDLVKINRRPISNVESSDAFLKVGDTTQITYIYATKNPRTGELQIYYIYLVLGVMRGA